VLQVVNEISFANEATMFITVLILRAKCLAMSRCMPDAFGSLLTCKGLRLTARHDTTTNSVVARCTMHAAMVTSDHVQSVDPRTLNPRPICHL